MFRTGRQSHVTTVRAAEATKQAVQAGSAQLDAAVEGLLRHVNQANLPALVHGVIVSLTGDGKAAKKAQRATTKALRKGTRTLSRAQGRYHPSGRKWILALAVLGAAGSGAVLAWRRLPHHEEPAQTTHPPYKPEGLAGAMTP